MRTVPVYQRGGAPSISSRWTRQATAGIDDVRELRDKIAFAPSDLKRKVYLLDEVHMLTMGAFNALLKTLEEPPRARGVHPRDDGTRKGSRDDHLPLPTVSTSIAFRARR